MTSEQPTEPQSEVQVADQNNPHTKYFYFPCPSDVKVADHVTLKLRPTNYLLWKQLMLSFLKSYRLQGFVDGTIRPMNKPPSLLRKPLTKEKRSAEEEKVESKRGQKDWDQPGWDSEKEQKHVEEWEHKRVKEWKDEQERRWEAKWSWEQKQLQELLQNNREKSMQVWKESQKGKSRQKLDQEREEEWKRQREWEQKQEREQKQEGERRKKWKLERSKNSNLSQEEELRQGTSDRDTKQHWDREREREHQEKLKWERWEESERGEKLQLEIRDAIREKDHEHTEWKRADSLIREWILALVTEETLPQVIHLKTAQDMWKKLEEIFTTPLNQPSSSHELIDWTDQRTGEDLSRYVVLHKAALAGDWEAAKEFLEKEPDAVFRPITWSLETALIVAARSNRRNKLVKKLIMWMVRERNKQETIEWIERMWEMERETMELIQSKRERGIRSEWEMMEMMEQEKLNKINVIIENKEQKGTDLKEWWRMERMLREKMMEKLDMMTRNMMDRIKLEIRERMEGMKRAERETSERTKRLMMEATKWQKMEEMARDRMQRMRQSVMLLVETDISGATALHTAVKGGNMEVVKWLVCVNPLLANIVDMYGTLPVHLAARLGKREMVELLLRCNAKISDYESGHKLWHSMVTGGLYDMALALLQYHPKLASMEPSPLMELIAQNNVLFRSGIRMNSFEHLIYSGIPLKLETAVIHPPKEGVTKTPNRHRGGARRAEMREREKREKGTVRTFVANFFVAIRLSELENTANDPQQRELEDTADRGKGWDIENQNPAKCVVPPLTYVRQKLKKLNELLWDVAEERVSAIKSTRKTKLIHHQASMLVECLCEKVVETNFSNAAKIFKEPLFAATRMGIPEMVEVILKWFPGAIHMTSEKNRSLFHIAIKYRQTDVYDLIKREAEDEYAALMSMPDVSGNNALHLAGKLGSKQQLSLRENVAGAVLQMQSELFWFKEVGKVILPQAKERRNEDGRTPQELFTETHKEMVTNGEKWMKDTASSCSIVAILIMTIAFAAAITVPGGSDGQTGIPIRLGESAFTVFGISNALALMGSSASLLMFLSIQMGRYGELDFLDSIPHRMVFGLVTLFSSVICMIVAFFGAFITVFGEKKRMIIIPVAALSSVPSALLVWSICRSLLDTTQSSYNSNIIWCFWMQRFRNLRRRNKHESNTRPPFLKQLDQPHTKLH